MSSIARSRQQVKVSKDKAVSRAEVKRVARELRRQAKRLERMYKRHLNRKPDWAAPYLYGCAETYRNAARLLTAG